jgi:hypothetical protein
MRPIAQGRPGTEVIPTGWAAAHQPVVEGTLQDAFVELSDPTAAPVASGWSDTNQQNETIPAGPYWAGGARIQILAQQGKQPVVAEDQESVANYLVVVPADVNASEGHRVKVNVSDDPALTGKSLRVVTMARGSHRWERDLFCELTD